MTSEHDEMSAAGTGSDTTRMAKFDAQALARLAVDEMYKSVPERRTDGHRPIR